MVLSELGLSRLRVDGAGLMQVQLSGPQRRDFEPVSEGLMSGWSPPPDPAYAAVETSSLSRKG
jgi:hypothetical protein